MTTGEEMIVVNLPLFKLGAVVATPGVLEALERAGQNVWVFLTQHLAGDWGVVDADDKAANEQSLKDGSRLLSAYLLSDPEKTKIWVVTEATDDNGVRQATTVLLPDEY
jgi:hypothetical protein